MTPKLAVAVNLAQLVALDNHSKLFLKKVSLVVPQCMKAFEITVAEWQIELRTMSFKKKIQNFLFDILRLENLLFKG